jgi:hypothetical protein
MLIIGIRVLHGPCFFTIEDQFLLYNVGQQRGYASFVTKAYTW